MNPFRREFWGWAVAGPLAVLLLAWAAPGGLLGQPPREQQITDTEKQIAEISKQLAELNKKLEELKKPATAAQPTTGEFRLPADWVKTLTWRSIGPANMGGRIIALAVYEADPTTYWVATASGGLLKTTNNGVTFDHQFDREATVSIGDVAVAPSNKDIVWVGTGENNPRNSVSYGDGVYKSTDGGKTWKNMGLNKTFQIGRIAIHPKDPNIVYVGALGRLYGPNPERGLFKTTNGGETWEKVLFIDDKTGVIDVQMNPKEPDTLLVATYERERDLYDTNDPSKKFGPGTGLYKTTDGGKTWKKLQKGLPTCQLGRMGIDYYRKDPNTVFLILESEKIGMGPPGTATGPAPGSAYMGIVGDDAEGGAVLNELTAGAPAEKAGLRAGDVITEVGGRPIRNYDALLDVIRSHKVGDKVKVKFLRDKKPAEVDLTFEPRPADPSGVEADPSRPFGAQLGGQRENVQDRQGPEGYQYGGVYKSTDGGESWTRINSLNPRPMYFSQVRVDPSDDKYVYVLGVSLYRSNDGGKTFAPNGGRGVHADQHALWIDPKDGRHMVLGCDGGFYVTYDRMERWDHLNHMAIGQFYHVAIDTRRNYRVYGGLQDNGTWGGPSNTRAFTGPINEDWVSVGGGDGFGCRVDPNDPDQVYFTSQNGGLGRRNFRTGETGFIRPRPASGQQFRFNWNTPFILSSHNSRIYYCAGNYVFKSLDRGSDLRIISPEVTATKKGSATALAESPRNPNLLYVGTDDGNLWVTKDGGREWTNITANVKLPGPRCVASIEPSRFDENRCYVAFDGHRSNDDDPLVFVTEDAGKTWTPIRANLPWGSTRVLREDIQNPNLLFVGTEFAVWASLDRGKSWTKINNNLPTVAVHELALHPTTGEMVAATHGRSLWILDVSALRQVTPEVVKGKAFLFRPTSAVRWRLEPGRGGTNRRFVGENPPNGAQIYYAINKKVDKITLKVLDHDGQTLRELTARGDVGFHRVVWDLTRPPARQAGTGPAPGRGTGPGGPRRGQPGGQAVPPGAYRVVLTVDGEDFGQSVRVEADPSLPPGDGIAGVSAPEPDDGDDEEEHEKDPPKKVIY